MRFNYLKGCLVLVLILIGTTISLSQCPILPTPTIYQENKGAILLGEEISVNSNDLPDNIRTMLSRRLTEEFGIRMVVTPKSQKLSFHKLENVPQDFYSINVDENIRISYSSEASCFYAINSLFQMMSREEQGVNLIKCFVSDHPKYQWRGLHLDVSRHFFTVDEVKRYIDLMSYYKFNTFHWHLTDDQGWRIEIKKYPKLTSVGAYRDSTVIGHYNRSPREYEVKKYGGFYTQEEIKDIVLYAKKRYVTIVPEIEMPGHSRAALAAYPELSCTGETQNVPGLWGIFDDIYCSKEESIRFLQDVLDEVLFLFPSEYIHIGGDEAPKTKWKECEKCQKVIAQNGLKDEHELQSYFIHRMDEYLTAKGRKLIGWDEILEGGLSPNAAVMSWRGFEGGIEAAKQGHYVVMSPGSHCYFDHYQSTLSTEPVAIGGYTPLNKVYAFDPTPEDFSPAEASYVLGGQANLWTEYIPDFSHLEYMTYPRAIALSQTLWCTKKPSYEFFKEVLINHHLPFLKTKEVNYSEALFYPVMQIFEAENGLKIHFKGEGEYRYDLYVTTTDPAKALKGGMVVEKKDTLYFERLKGSDIHEYTFKLSNDLLTQPIIYHWTNHSMIGIKPLQKTTPSPQYPGNEISLSDGVFGAEPWKGYEWVGYRQSEPLIYIYDLGKSSVVEKVQISALEDEGSWIHLPQNFLVEVSKNNKKWKPVKSTSSVFSKSSGKGGFTSGILMNVKKVRYVKIVVQPKERIEGGKPGANNIPWTFLDEIRIIHRL